MINNNFLEDMKAIREKSVLHFVTKVKKLLYVYNEYASDVHGDVIYENDDDNLEEMLQGLDAVDIVNKIYFGDYQKADAYITFDGGGNIKTLHYEEFYNLYIDDSDFISYCNENDINLYEESKGQ
jgi:hypothetical protein